MNSENHPATTFKSRIKSSLPYTLAVAIIGFVSLWVRMRPYDHVFLSNGFVKFTSNDPWYHIRTLNVLLENYPQRMFFNPMTNYPYGSYIHFGPLYDQMMAITSLILGLGSPSQDLINTVGAYFPAVLGALTVIPVYYIGNTSEAVKPASSLQSLLLLLRDSFCHAHLLVSRTITWLSLYSALSS